MTDTRPDLAAIEARRLWWSTGPRDDVDALLAEVARLTAELARTDAILRDYLVIGTVETFRAALAASDGES